MLSPRFMGMPPGFELQEDGYFRVKGFARFGDYTLVEWQSGTEQESVTGETLYKGDRYLAHSGGQLDIAPPTDPDGASAQHQSVFNRISPSIGRYGVPVVAATALRNPQNRRRIYGNV